MKIIEFKGKKYKTKVFHYLNTNKGLMLINVDNEKAWFSATVNFDNLKIRDKEIIIKNHDFNRGLMEVLVENKIINKQNRAIPLGKNKVYICKLING